MGSCLEIISDHNLKFVSGQKTLTEFSKKLNINISDGDHKSLTGYPKTERIEEIEYFIPIDYLDVNFERWNEVKILSNYVHCPEIKICKNTLIISSGLRFKYWRDVIVEKLNEPTWENQYEFTRIKWNKLMSYIPKLVKPIGGKNLIFFEDDRFQNTIDLCYQGKNINEISNAMKLQWEPTKIEEILKLKNHHKVKNGWFYQKISNAI